MDHATSLAIHAADRYPIGDLSETEQNNFEEHFFGCPECAEEVRIGTIFAANVRAVLREAPLKVAPGTQTGAAFHNAHPYLAVAGGEPCGMFSNAAAAMTTARHWAHVADIERQRLDPRAMAARFYVCDRRTGQRITQADLEAQRDKP